MQASSSLEFIVSLIDNTKAQFTEIGKNLDELGKRTQSSKDVMQETAIKSGLAFGALSLYINNAVGSFAAFDASIQKAGANVSASAETLQEFRDVALKVGIDTGVGAQAAADALSKLAGGSITAKDAMGALQDTITFAKANQLDLNTATVISSQVMTMFKLRAEDMTRALDVFTRSTQISWANAQQMSDAFSQVAPIAAQMGVSLVDLTSIIGALGDAGYIGSEAGTALKRAFDQILSGSPQVTDALLKLDLSVDTMKELLPHPIEMLRLLQTRLEGIQSPVERAAILSDIFGQGAGPAMAALIGNGVDAIDAYRDSLNEAGGALSETAERLKSAGSPFEVLTAAIQGLQIVIGQALRPTLESLSNALKPVVMGVLEFVEAHPRLVSAVILIVTAVTGLTFVMATLSLAFLSIPGTIFLVTTALGYFSSGLIYATTSVFGLSKMMLGSLVTAFETVTVAMGETAVGVGVLNTALSIGVVGAILGVIGLLVAVGIQFYKLSEEVGGVKNAWTLAWLSMEETFWNWVDKVLSGIDWVVSKIPGLGHAMDGLLDSVRQKSKDAAAAADVFALSLYDQATAAKTASEKTKTSTESILDSMKMIPPVSSASAKAAKQHWDDLAKSLANVRDEVTKTYADMKKASDDYLSSVGKEQSDYSTNVVDTVAQAKKDIEDLTVQQNSARAKGNYDEVASLGQQIQQKQAILISYNQMQLNLDDQIAEREKYLKMNELQQLEYNHQQKLKQLQIEYLQTQVQSLQKILTLTNESNQILALVDTQKRAKLEADAEMQRSADARIKDEAAGIKGFLQSSIQDYQNYAATVNGILNTIKFTSPGGFSNPNANYFTGARASGGPVSAGQSYLVGENGPELFTPTQYGSISTGGSPGGLTIVITGNSFMGREGIAEQISDDIMKNLKRNIKI